MEGEVPLPFSVIGSCVSEGVSIHEVTYGWTAPLGFAKTEKTLAVSGGHARQCGRIGWPDPLRVILMLTHAPESHIHLKMAFPYAHVGALVRMQRHSQGNSGGNLTLVPQAYGAPGKQGPNRTCVPPTR